MTSNYFNSIKCITQQDAYHFYCCYHMNMTSSRDYLYDFFEGPIPKDLPCMREHVCLVNFLRRHDPNGNVDESDYEELRVYAQIKIFERQQFLVSKDVESDLMDDDDSFDTITSVSSSSTFTDISEISLNNISTELSTKKGSSFLCKVRSFGRRLKELFCCF